MRYSKKIIQKAYNRSILSTVPHLQRKCYNTYWIIIHRFVKEFDAGDQFSQLGLNLLEKLKNKKGKSEIMFNLNVFITHWEKECGSFLVNK